MYGGADDPSLIYSRYKTDLIARLHGDLTFTDGGADTQIPPAFFQSDPSGAKHTYLDWLVRSYIRGGIPNYGDLVPRALPALITFGRLKDKLPLGNSPMTNMRDIKNYCGLVGCTVMVRGVETVVPGLEAEMASNQVPQPHKKKYNRQVFESSEIKIYNPLTVEESCHYGRGTKWCTAASNDNQFEVYGSMGALYIVVPKSPAYYGEKYQLYPQFSEYTDEENEDISIADLFDKYPSLVGFLIRDVGSIISLCSQYESDLGVAKIILYIVRNNIISIPMLLNEVMPYIPHSHTDIMKDEASWIRFYSRGEFKEDNYSHIILGIDRGKFSPETRQEILSILSRTMPA
jgi:hypothetical protein